MKSKFASVNGIGDLYFEDVFVEFGSPILFSCTNKFHTVFLVVASKFDREKESWIIVKISRSRLNSLLNNSIYLYDVFKEPEDKTIYQLIHYCHTENYETIAHAPNDIDDSLLPAQNEYLDYEREVAFAELNDLLPSIIESANSTLAVVSEICVNTGDGSLKHTISSYYLCQLLEKYSELKACISTSETESKRLSKAVLLKHDDLVVSSFAGSFGIRLMSKSYGIDPDADYVKAFERLYQLLLFDSVSDEFNVFFRSCSPMVTAKYKSFLETLQESNYSVDLRTAIPQKTEILSFKLDRPGIAKRRTLLESLPKEEIESLEIDGRLFGIDFNKKVFSFIAGEETYCGKIIDSIVDAARNNKESYEIPSNGKIYISKAIKYDSINSEGKEYLTMTDYIRSENNTSAS